MVIALLVASTGILNLYFMQNSCLYSIFSTYSVFCAAYGVLAALASPSAPEKILDETDHPFWWGSSVTDVSEQSRG